MKKGTYLGLSSRWERPRDPHMSHTTNQYTSDVVRTTFRGPTTGLWVTPRSDPKSRFRSLRSLPKTEDGIFAVFCLLSSVLSS